MMSPSLLSSFHPQTHEQVEKDPDLAELVEEDIGGEAHYGTKPDHSAAAAASGGPTTSDGAAPPLGQREDAKRADGGTGGDKIYIKPRA